MKIKLAALTVLLLAQSHVYAEPNRFSVANRSTQIFSFKVNGVCSKEIGDVNAYYIKSLPNSNISCIGKSECIINAYNKPNCAGELIGEFKISSDSTTVSVLPKHSSQYEFTGGSSPNEYNIFINEITNK